MSTIINATTTNGVVIQPDNSGSLVLQTNSGTTALTISTAQNATFAAQATIPTINLTGGQITFPATAVPSADANTLDDYEEGTWTVTIGDGTNNYTANFVTGIYTKIGNLVTAAGLITWTSIGSAGAGQLRLSLPFTSVNVNFARFGAALGLIAGFDTVVGTKQIMANLDQGANYLTFWQINDNASATALPSNAQSATGQVQFTISYTV
jgi:hypothetical protein